MEWYVYYENPINRTIESTTFSTIIGLLTVVLVKQKSVRMIKTHLQ